MPGADVPGAGRHRGRFVLHFRHRGKYKPTIGIAGVSCVPNTARIVQKLATQASRGNIVMPHALGTSMSGVITSAILTGIFVAMLR